MEGFEGIGRVLIVVGIVLVVRVLFVSFGGRTILGKLSGGILIRKDGFSFYFLIVTFLLLSVVLTLIINFIMRLIGRI
ncbi:DUF2905 family protein [Chloroflexota bacterium]